MRTNAVLRCRRRVNVQATIDDQVDEAYARCFHAEIKRQLIARIDHKMKF